MKRTRHSPDQIIAKLREADALRAIGASIGRVCRRIGVSEQTFRRWRNQYGGTKSAGARRLDEFCSCRRLGPSVRLESQAPITMI